MNIRELDEESRRTGVWPPRRIILRVEREGDEAEAPAEARPAPVKVAEVGLAGSRAAAGSAKPKPAPPPLAPSLAPSVTPSRRRGLPGARGVTPAAGEDAEFEKWVAAPLANADSEPEYQAPPAWLPDDVRLRAERRHRRVARKARTQLFGASAATTLAVGGAAAVVALVGLSQTESVGGAVGAPSIGLFGSPPQPPSNNKTADTAPAQPAAQQPARSEPRRSSARRTRPAGSPPARPRSSDGASAPARESSPSTSRAPAAPAADRPARAQPQPQNQNQNRATSPPPAPTTSSPAP